MEWYSILLYLRNIIGITSWTNIRSSGESRRTKCVKWKCNRLNQNRCVRLLRMRWEVMLNLPATNTSNIAQWSRHAQKMLLIPIGQSRCRYVCHHFFLCRLFIFPVNNNNSVAFFIVLMNLLSFILRLTWMCHWWGGSAAPSAIFDDYITSPVISYASQTKQIVSYFASHRIFFYWITTLLNA